MFVVTDRIFRLLCWGAALWFAAMVGFTLLVLGPLGLDEVLDRRVFGYRLVDVQSYGAGMTEVGLLRLGQLRLMDTVFPPLLCLVLLGVMRRLQGVMRALWLLPVLYCGLDWAENAAVAGLIGAQVLTAEAVARASILTQAKYGVLILAGLAALAARRRGLR